MKQTTRLLALLLALLTILSLAACGQTDTPAADPSETADQPDTTPDAETPAETPDETPDAPADETPAEHALYMQYITADVCQSGTSYDLPLVDEPTTLQFWWPLFSSYLQYDLTSQDDYLMFAQMKERTGVDVELIIPSSASEQFGLMMASGDIPDFVYGFYSYYSGGLDHAVEEDVVANLKDYESIMPNLFTVLRSNETFWKGANTDSGYIALVPHIQSNLQGTADRSWMGYAISEDWLNELGMEVPETYSQLETLLKAMKGTYCEYPFILHGFNGNFMLDYGSKFWGGYNVDSSWYQVDGQVKYGPLEDGYRDYIQMLVNWYQEGLMTDTFLQPYGDGGYMTVSSSDVCATDDSVGVLPVNYTMMDDLYKVNADKENYGLLGLPFLKVNEGDTLHLGRQAPNIVYSSSGAVMVDGGDVELTCKWFDYLFSDEGMLLYNYGVEDQTFTFDETGKPQWIVEKFRSTDPKVSDHQLWHQQVGFNEPGYHQFDREFVMYSPEVLALYDVWYNSYDIEYNYPSTATRTAEEGEDYTRIMSDVETYLNENLIQFLVGDKSMDEWDSFRDQLSRMHLDEAMAIQQAALDRYNNR